MTEKLNPIPQTVEAKIEYAEALKLEGNAFVKEGKYKKALGRYKRIPAYITGLEQNIQGILSGQMSENNPIKPPVDEKNKPELSEEAKKINSLTMSSNLNISLCYFKLGMGLKCRDYANRVLKAEKDHPKALFRRGQGFMVQGLIDLAKV